MVEQLGREPAGSPFDPTAQNRGWQDPGKRTADQRAIPPAFAPSPARDLEAGLDDGLRDEGIEHGISSTEARLEIGLNAEDGRDVGGGVMWPFTIQRERNGEKIFEIFSESVKINQDLKDNMFTLPANMKIIGGKKK